LILNAAALSGKYKATSCVNTACDICEAGKFRVNAGVNLACDNCEAAACLISVQTKPERVRFESRTGTKK
jgi:hypothetical protein